MAVIRTICESHGDLELTVADVVVVENMTFSEGHTGRYNYRYICPKGGEIVLRSADVRTTDLLTASGCNLTIIGAAVVDTVGGQLLTDDDAIDFHYSLEHVLDPGDITGLFPEDPK